MMSKKPPVLYFKVGPDLGGGVYPTIDYTTETVLLDIANDPRGSVELSRNRVTPWHCLDSRCYMPVDSIIHVNSVYGAAHPAGSALKTPLTIRDDGSVSFRAARYRELYEAFLTSLSNVGPMPDAHARFSAAERLVGVVRNYGWEPRKQ